ncbi:adenylate kinase isoenzyme 5 [Orussus abietinus]|uniref:adenylate kinase isoenzyme 5 n=1 Tax=Orussus abietinus TaxID=222816 RepID=UPI00062582A4|nr:adenylate kinase isoenzyme 5 [Orussus abietinus]
MGICLDTEQQDGSQVYDDGDARSAGKWRGEAGLLATPPEGNFPMQNVGPVKFETPKVPVIFVLGGPGSGKVTHCDTLTQETKGITHINMTDLLQQYALGNDMQDFSQLSSKTVTEVLMLEMKMSPGAKTFLVSGYPRNMRDVVEYSEKIQIVNGVVLVSWRQELLERQINYGAQLGQVILRLARMELQNFYRNVMPVAEYFDQSGMLLAINGERNPSEVYVDFRDAVMRILRVPEENPKSEVPQSVEAEVQVERTTVPVSPPAKQIVVAEITPPSPADNVHPSKTADKPRKGIPLFIWVIGGPGSNKATLCTQAVRNIPGWVHVSIGGLLRNMASSNPVVNEAIVSGGMVPQDVAMQLVEQQVILNRDTDGILLDGFPRDINQVQEFENKFGQKPPLVLLDCSKLQLGRGRPDDNVTSFRRRLELFREISLPMLKALDNDNRLTIIDGDTDVPSVQQDFAAALYQLQRGLRIMEEGNPRLPGVTRNNDGRHPNSLASVNINGGRKIIGSGKKKQSATRSADRGVGALATQVDKMANTMAQNFARNKSHREDDANPPRNSLINGTISNAVNSIDSISRKVQDVTDQKVTQMANGGTRIANGVLTNAKPTLGNGVVRQSDNVSLYQNGIANGAAHVLQNGVAHLTNGIPGNKIAPEIGKRSKNLTKDPLTRMINEVESYQHDLHI